MSKKLLVFRNQCYAGCPANTTCEWGMCQCSNPNHIQIWGECVERDVTSCHQRCHQESPGVKRCDQRCHQERNSTVFDEEAEGKPCTETLFCQEQDINLVCEGSSSVFGVTVLPKCGENIGRWGREASLQVQEGDEVEQCCSGVSGLIFSLRQFYLFKVEHIAL